MPCGRSDLIAITVHLELLQLATGTCRSARCVGGLCSWTAFTGHRDVGVVLTPIITKDTIALDALRGRTLAVDGNGELYQFLALIRLRDGTPLQRFERAHDVAPLRPVLPHHASDGRPRRCGWRSCSTARRRRSRRRRSRSAVPARQRYEEERAAALARGDLATGLLESDDDLTPDARDGGGGARAVAAHGRADHAGASEGEAQAAHMAATSPTDLGGREQRLRFAALRRAQAGALPDHLRQGIPAQPGHLPADRAGDDRARVAARRLAHQSRGARGSRDPRRHRLQRRASRASDRRRRWRSCRSTAASSACRTTSGTRLGTPRR